MHGEWYGICICWYMDYYAMYYYNDKIATWSVMTHTFTVFVILHESLQWRNNGRDGVSNHQLIILYSNVYSGADQRKHQNSASLAFVRGIHRWPMNSPHKWPVTRKMFPFDDIIMMFVSCDIEINFVQVGTSRMKTTRKSAPEWPSIFIQDNPCVSLFIVPPQLFRTRTRYFSLRHFAQDDHIHYGDVIMSAMASQIISLTIVYFSHRSFSHRSKKTWKLCVTGLCEGTGDRWIPGTKGQ